MRGKPVWQLSVATTEPAAEFVSSLLEAMLGLSPVTYQNERTSRTTVSIYSERPIAWTPSRRAEFRSSIKTLCLHGLETGSCRATLRRLPSEDWAESWKKHFRPIQIGRALLVKPSWIKRKPLRGQEQIILDPGLSFGTGNHPTTRFCLRQLVAHRPRASAKSFLDTGTGSGILAIAAAKLGYRPVQAFDFDPDAVRTARDNIRLNGVAKLIRLFRADVTQLPMLAKNRVDLLCANLQSPLLLAERRRLIDQVNRGGTLVLAGILTREFTQVRSACEQSGLRLTSASASGAWTSGEFLREC